MNSMTLRWIAVTAFLATGAAVVIGATDNSPETVAGSIHSDEDEMSRQGDTWKENSTAANPMTSTGTDIHSSKEKMSLKGDRWKDTSTTASPTVSTGTNVSTHP